MSKNVSSRRPTHAKKTEIREIPTVNGRFTTFEYPDVVRIEILLIGADAHARAKSARAIRLVIEDLLGH
jgi:hypothetical protein